MQGSIVSTDEVAYLQLLQRCPMIKLHSFQEEDPTAFLLAKG